MDPFQRQNDEVVNDAWAARFLDSRMEIGCIYMMLTTLLKVTDEIHSRFKSSQERLDTAQRSKGIKSLPDELLAKIFQMSVWEYHEHREGMKRAVQLSVVSRRFRSVALGEHGLWTVLDASSSKAQLKTFIARAGPNQGFQVSLRLNNHEQNRKFYRICHSTISRWSTLTLEYGDSGTDASTALEEIFGSFVEGGIQFTFLNEMRLHGKKANHFVGLLPATIQSLAPNLHTLRCPNFLPSLSQPLLSVSTLVVSHSLQSGSGPASALQILLNGLLKLPNLLSFELEAHWALDAAPQQVLPVTECRSITSFQLVLPNVLILDTRIEDSCIAGFMNAVRMPLLEEYAVFVIPLGLDGDEGDSKWSQATGKLSRALLPNHLSTSTRAPTVCYRLLSDSYSTLRRSPILPDRTELRIPLDRILCFPTLVLSSFNQILFIKETEVEDPDFERHVGEHRCLQELKLIGCKNMTQAHLRHTIGSLEAVGAWSDIERVIIQDCKHLTREDAMDVIGEERLQYMEVERYTDLRGSRAILDMI